MLHYLITGGAGFIGSHLAERLTGPGGRVTVLDNLSSGSAGNLASLQARPGFRFVQGDVCDRTVLDPLMAECDVVFHLAATVGVLNIIKSPVETIGNNIDGTHAVLRSASVRKQRVIVASTSEVYGKSERIPFHEDDDLVLGPTVKSRWSYAASKIVDEFLALAYWREFGVPSVVVRFFNTIGPRQSGEYGMVVPRFVQQALAGVPLTVFGSGNQSRAFTDVTDIVEWLVRLSSNDAAIGEVFNLGNIEVVTILELAQRVIALTGSASPIERIAYDQAYESGFEDIEQRLPDISKVIALTGYRPVVSLAESLERIRTACLVDAMHSGA